MKSKLALPFVVSFLAACGHKGNDDAAGTQGVNSPEGAAPQDAAASAEAGSGTFTVDWLANWEDGNRAIIPVGGRFGHWYNYDDQSPGMKNIAVVGLDPLTE